VEGMLVVLVELILPLRVILTERLFEFEMR
jgi:hypothetical protein